VDSNIVLGIGLAGVLILVGIAGNRILSTLKPTSLTEQQILDALKPWALKAIIAGEQMAITKEGDLDKAIQGVDKFEVASAVYNLLPPVIHIGGLTVDVKSLITRDAFDTLIDDLFEETHAFILANEDYLRKQVPTTTT